MVLKSHQEGSRPDLAYMQMQVAGYIERVDEHRGAASGFTIDVWGNEEARLTEGMKPNVLRRDGEELWGPLTVLASDPDGNSVWLTMSEANRVQVIQMAGLRLPIIRVLEVGV
jgi:hypothetical protein